MKRFGPYLVLVVLLAAGFSMATVLLGRVSEWSQRGRSGNVLQVLFGDGRRMFANQFFTEADVSFHSGYYPSIFDQARAPKDSRHLTAKEGEPEAEEHEKHMDFLGPPRDWIERFGRHFMVTEHTHLHGSTEAEILPWLRIASEMDPHKVETYTVAAYWLCDLGKVKEAEAFLRQGLLSNPGNYEILFELGRLYYLSNHDPARARKIWEYALREWTTQEAAGQQPDLVQLDQIAMNLARLEEHEGNLPRAIQLLEISQKASPYPQAVQRQIVLLKQKLDTHRPAASAASH